MPDKTQNPAEGAQPAGPKVIIVGAIGADLVSLITQKILEAEPSAVVVHLEQDPTNQVASLQNVLNEKIELTVFQAAQVKNLADELVQAENLLTGQKATIDELTTRIAELEKNPSTVPTFTFGTGANRKTYEVHTKTFKYQAPGEQPREYSHEELLKDSKLQAALIKKGVGFIVEKA